MQKADIRGIGILLECFLETALPLLPLFTDVLFGSNDAVIVLLIDNHITLDVVGKPIVLIDFTSKRTNSS